MVYNIPKLGAQENLHREDTAALQLQYITWDMEMHLQIPLLNKVEKFHPGSPADCGGVNFSLHLTQNFALRSPSLKYIQMDVFSHTRASFG